MASLKSTYARLFEKALGKALDPSAGTMFTFPKYCKRCGQGITQPNPWDRRTVRRHFRISFCSDHCEELGEKYVGVFQSKASTSHISSSGDMPVEELAFVALEMKREEEAMPPMKRLVHRARQMFSLLSEQLGYLEMETGQSWSAAKCRYWMSKKK